MCGDVLGAFDFKADVEKDLAQPQRTTAPIDVDEAIAGLERQKRCDEKAQAAPEQGAGAQQQVKEEGPDCLQDRHSDIYRCGHCPPVQAHSRTFPGQDVRRTLVVDKFSGNRRQIVKNQGAHR